jgi:AMMECR1 domain-containing protein
MNNLARIILESYLFEKKTLTQWDLLKIQPLTRDKSPVFITIIDGENIVASSGRIYPSHENFWEELIDNVIMAASDPRFQPYIDNHEKIRKLRFRVDVFHDTDRRILHHPDELDGATEGMILLCQAQEKVWIILPHMFKNVLSGEEVYHHLIRKINLDTAHLGKWDVILYAVKTEIFEDSK